MDYRQFLRERSTPILPLPTHIPFQSSLPKPPSAVLFDVYGTLFASVTGDVGVRATPADSADESIRRLFERYGIRLSGEEAKRKFKDYILSEHARLNAHGVLYPEIRVEELWQTVLGVDEERAKEIAAQYEAIVNAVYPMPYFEETLLFLKERNVILGIISNAQFYTERLFDVFLPRPLEDYGFRSDLLLFSWRYREAKPSPALFEMAVQTLLEQGVRADEALFVGNDMRNDIVPARACGMKTALFAGDMRSLRLREDDAAVRGVRPDVTLSSLNDIPLLFQS